MRATQGAGFRRDPRLHRGIMATDDSLLERPTVDYVLAALRSSAEQREPKHREISILSPMDDRSQILLVEKSDSPVVPEDESGVVTITVSASFRSSATGDQDTSPLTRASLRSRTFDCKDGGTAQTYSCYP